jgi:hypothetical protein
VGDIGSDMEALAAGGAKRPGFGELTLRRQAVNAERAAPTA